MSVEERLATQLFRIRIALNDAGSELERSAALASLRSVSTSWLRIDLPDEPPMPWERQCLHWPLAFPEVFLGERGCFDAVVANPPFLGGHRISGTLGGAFPEYLVESVAGGAKGSSDLVGYFLLRMCAVGREVSSLATNTVAQGDTAGGCDRPVADGRMDYSPRSEIRGVAQRGVD